MDPPRTPSTNQTHSVAWLGSAVVERKEKTTNKTTKTDGKGFMHLWAGDGEKLSSSTRAGWLGFACSGVLRNKMRRVDRILGMGVFGASDHMAERNESLTTQNHDKTGGLFVFFFFFFFAIGKVRWKGMGVGGGCKDISLGGCLFGALSLSLSSFIFHCLVRGVPFTDEEWRFPQSGKYVMRTGSGDTQGRGAGHTTDTGKDDQTNSLLNSASRRTQETQGEKKMQLTIPQRKLKNSYSLSNETRGHDESEPAYPRPPV